MGDWTGTVPTFAAGAKLRGVDQQTLADIDTALTGALTTWTPTLANITQGSGVVVAQYRRVGKWVDFVFSFTLGAGSAIGTSPTFTLPATPAAKYGSGVPIGVGWFFDSGTGRWEGSAFNLSAAIATVVYATEAGGGSGSTITATAPFTWTTSDVLAVTGGYETT